MNEQLAGNRKAWQVSLIGIAVILLWFSTEIAAGIAAGIQIAFSSVALGLDMGTFEEMEIPMVLLTKYSMVYGIIIKALVLLPVMYIGYKNEYVKKFRKIFTWEFLGKLAMYTVIVFAITYATDRLSAFAFSDLYGQVAENQLLLEEVSQTLSPFLMFLAVVIAAPLFEEFIFRFILIDKVFGFLPAWVAGFFSLLIFALIHVAAELATGDINLIMYTALQYIPMSLIFVVAYVREKNVYMNTAIHFVVNLVGFLALSAVA